MYSSTLCLTSALCGSDQLYCPNALPQERQPAPTVQETVRTSGTEWTGKVNLASAKVGTPELPARGDSLHRLSYPGHHVIQYLDQ